MTGSAEGSRNRQQISQSEQLLGLALSVQKDWGSRRHLSGGEITVTLESLGVVPPIGLTQHPSGFNHDLASPALEGRVKELKMSIEEDLRLLTQTLASQTCLRHPLWRESNSELIRQLNTLIVHLPILGEIESRDDAWLKNYGVQWQEGMKVWGEFAGLGQDLLNRASDVEELFCIAQDLIRKLGTDNDCLGPRFQKSFDFVRRVRYLNNELTVLGLSEPERIWTPTTVVEMTHQYIQRPATGVRVNLTQYQWDELYSCSQHLKMEELGPFLDFLEAIKLLQAWIDKFDEAFKVALTLSVRFCRWAGQLRHMTA